MTVLSVDQIADLVVRHFPDGTVAQTGIGIRETACAVSRAESGWRTDAVGDVGLTGGPSIGLWQIAIGIHQQFDRNSLFDPNYNAEAAVQVSGNGSNWNPWCTWEPTACRNTGLNAYRPYVEGCTAAIAKRAAPPPSIGPIPGSGPPPSAGPPPGTWPPPVVPPVPASGQLAAPLLLLGLTAALGALYWRYRSTGQGFTLEAVEGDLMALEGWAERASGSVVDQLDRGYTALRGDHSVTARAAGRNRQP